MNNKSLHRYACSAGLLSVLLLSASALAGCVRHISPYKPKIRNYKPERYDAMANRHVEGSLWNSSSDTLFTFRRASRIGDLITVVISESANATRDAGTNLSRSSSMQLGVDNLFGLMAALKKAAPNVDPSKLIGAASKNDFSGKGQTSRAGSLRAKITARIKRVMPNGDFYIEGHKVVLVNEEESHFYISGVVRPADVQADNSVVSGKLADAQVEYTGRGVIADKQKPGWFSRFLDWVNPF